MSAIAKPLIKFLAAENTEIPVRCANGHETFRLTLRYRLAGTLVTRHATCTECGDSEPLDQS